MIYEKEIVQNCTADSVSSYSFHSNFDKYIILTILSITFLRITLGVIATTDYQLGRNAIQTAGFFLHSS